MNKIVIAAVIKNKDGNVLAVHLKKEQPGGVWVMPGGKLEENESARDCVVREVKEELGIDIKPIRIGAIGEYDYGQGNIWIFVYYLCEIISGVPSPQEVNKTLDCKYMNPADLYRAECIVWLD